MVGFFATVSQPHWDRMPTWECEAQFLVAKKHWESKGQGLSPSHVVSHSSGSSNYTPLPASLSSKNERVSWIQQNTDTTMKAEQLKSHQFSIIESHQLKPMCIIWGKTSKTICNYLQLYLKVWIIVICSRQYHLTPTTFSLLMKSFFRISRAVLVTCESQDRQKQLHFLIIEELCFDHWLLPLIT